MAAASFVILLARASLADQYTVPSGSMQPTIREGDRLVVDKSAYGLRLPLSTAWLVRGEAPARGDVVVLMSPESGDILVKRVAALPHDVVEIHHGQISVDGEPAPVEPQGDELVEQLGGATHGVRLGDGGPDFGPVEVPANHYLVLGDNRGNSHDGRFFGWVRREAILGRVEGILLRSGGPSWIDLSAP